MSAQPLDPQLVNLAKAIRDHETQNRAIPGASGELKSRYQYMPATWKERAGKHLGNSNAPLSLENENAVTYAQLKEWKDQGYNPGQIASMWNSGQPDPAGKVGRNSKGVNYNTPKYVQDVYSKYRTYETERGVTASTSSPASRLGIPTANAAETGSSSAVPQRSFARKLASPLIGVAKGAGSTAFGLGKLIDKINPMENVVGDKPEFLKPKGFGEKLGYGVEQIAELAVPFGGGAKAASLIPKAGRAAQLGARALGEGAEFGLKSAVQTGGDAKSIGASAAFGAAFPIVGAGVRGVMQAIGFPLARVAKAGLQGVKKVLPGISDEAATTITRFPNEVEALAKQKSLPINPIVEVVTAAKEALKRKQSVEFAGSLKSVVADGAKITINKKPVLERLANFLRERYAATLSSKGTIASGPFPDRERRVVEKVIAEMRRSKVTDVNSVRNLKARILGIADSIIPANPNVKKPPAYLAIKEMANFLDQLLPDQLRQANKLYTNRERLMKTLKLLVPDAGTGNINPQALAKVRALGKEEYQGVYKDFFEAIKNETGIDIKTKLDIYNAAREINPNLIPQDIGGFMRGIQKAFNPAIGQSHIEIAKKGLSGFGASVGQNIGRSIRNSVSPVKRAVKAATVFTTSRLVRKRPVND